MCGRFSLVQIVKTIASASEDNTVRLWARHRNPLDTILQGHDRAFGG
jgi:WD40 repeat protein